MNKGLFVTGTDTGVGKTLVACGIVQLLRNWGAHVGVMKPIATGNHEDAKRLMQAAFAPSPRPSPEKGEGAWKNPSPFSGEGDPLDVINPQFFRTPLAPTVAASLERREVDLEAVYRAYWYLHKKYDVLIVEGIGGVKVPLGESTYVVDLIQALGLPALIVARASLGTLNHSLLTLDALAGEKIPVAGILLNGGHGRTLVEKTNPEELQDHTTVQVLGRLPWNARFSKDPKAAARALEQLPKFTKAVKRACGLS